jgi:hypothetical protein
LSLLVTAALSRGRGACGAGALYGAPQATSCQARAMRLRRDGTARATVWEHMTGARAELDVDSATFCVVL